MFFQLLFLMIIIFASWLLIRWYKVKNFWRNKCVPHYPPHPLMGSLTFLQKENPAVWMRKVYEDFRSPYVGMWLFWKPALVVNTPELARRVLVRDADNFRNRFLSSGKTDPIGSLNLFTVNDPIWSLARRRLTSTFTAAKLRAQETLVRTKSSNLVTRLEKEMNNDELIDLRALCIDFTTDIIGESAFGLKSESTLNGDSLLRQITRELNKFNTFRGLSWSSIFFFPELVDVFRFKLFPKDTITLMKKVLQSIVVQRGGYERKITECRDLLDALLKMKNEAVEIEDMNEDFLLAQAAIFLLGGFDTSGSTLTWVFYELAHQPQIQEKLYEELIAAKERNGGELMDSTVLAKVDYLNAIIKETLRKFTPMGWLDRIASNDYIIDDHLTIPAGTTVYVNSIGMHWDPQYFPKPEVFDPDRFMPENEKNITPYTFIPFGEGPRSCIGMRFAYQTMRFGVAAVVASYRAHAVPDAPAPNCCSVERRGLFLVPDDKLSITFTKRT